MADTRWRNPRVPPEETVLLLPAVPARASAPPDWLAALGAAGVATTGNESEADLVVTPAGRPGASAPTLVVDGADRRRRLARAGYQVAVYRTFSGPAGVVVADVEDSALAGRLSGWAGRRPARDLLVAGVRAVTGRHRVTVAHRGAVTPAVVVAAGNAPGCRVFLRSARHGGARRRAVFLVCHAAADSPHMVVKTAPTDDAGARGRAEQDILARLHGLQVGTAVPRPLGYGVVGPWQWAAESAVSGTALVEVLPRNRVAPIELLDNLAVWFTRLAVATRREPSADDGPGADLRGPHRELLERSAEWRTVPRVLAHGDVGTGLNVLVDDGRFGVIDWETASWDALPLADLLPLICTALATARGSHDSDAAAEHILRLCRGEDEASDWLFDTVRAHCRALSVPLPTAGLLAGLAWGRQASMRLVYEELVASVGGTVSSWRTAADVVAARWLDDPRLGPHWVALTERNS